MAPKPFVVEHSLTIRGGFTDKAISLDTEYINGKHFFGIRSFKDFRVLAAFGLAKQVRGSAGKVLKYDYQDCSLFEYVKQQRNKVVTRMINEQIAADDPIADAGDLDADIAKRKALFMQYDIPEICTVQLKGFELMGEWVPGVEASLLTTPLKQGVLKIECVGPTLDWLCNAAQTNPDLWQEAKTETPSRKRRIEDLPELPTPFKYKQGKHNGQILIHARIKCGTKWRAHQKRIDHLLDDSDEEVQIDDRMDKICRGFHRQLDQHRSKFSELDGGDDDDNDDDDGNDGDDTAGTAASGATAAEGASEQTDEALARSTMIARMKASM